MPKIHDMRELVKKEGGEYVLGLADLGTHACYLIYGELKPGEAGRKLCPGEGHEEILMVVSGELLLEGGGLDGTVSEGNAVHLVGVQACTASNPGDARAVYVMAGGHSEGGHRH